jgi:hypothetical protein
MVSGWVTVMSSTIRPHRMTLFPVKTGLR